MIQVQGWAFWHAVEAEVMVKPGLLILAVALLLVAVPAFLRFRRRRDALSMADDGSRYKPGQVWALRLPEAPQARLTILRVESFPATGTIVHVAVSDISLPVGHMPFTDGAIDRSVLELVRTGNVPATALEGYEEWRRAFEAGGAGVFSVTVPEALAIVYQAGR